MFDWVRLLPVGYGIMRSKRGWYVADQHGESENCDDHPRLEQAISEFLLHHCPPEEYYSPTFVVWEGKVMNPWNKPGHVENPALLFSDAVHKAANQAMDRIAFKAIGG